MITVPASVWLASLEEDNSRHATPIRDLREHLFTSECWCNPTLDDGVWVHHSLDKRELQ